MNFVDTHSHIYLSQFDDDTDEAVQRAIDAGVNKIVLPNIDSETITQVNHLQQKYPENCVPLMGLHPTYVKENYKEELDKIIEALHNGTYFGIGEIGIDLYWDKTFAKEQEEVFIKQLELSAELNLPIVIHARESFNEIYTILCKHSNLNLKGIFHAFTGSIDEANKIINLGFLLGIGGIVTFKNAGLDKVVAQIDLQHLVLETDSPYLAPTPHRGKRNESSYIPIIAQKIATDKNISIEEVAMLTSKNATKLFKL